MFEGEWCSGVEDDEVESGRVWVLPRGFHPTMLLVMWREPHLVLSCVFLSQSPADTTNPARPSDLYVPPGASGQCPRGIWRI